jgi:methylthioribose-1-phosphate isomerase
MSENNKMWFCFGIALGVIVQGVAMNITAEYFPERTKPYKQGQIDAANGKMKYELKKNSDNSTYWGKVNGTSN